MESKESEKSEKIELIVKVTMKQDTVERSLAALAAIAAASREEDGCERFRVLRPQDSLDLYMVETWTSAARWEEHKSAPHTKEFLGVYGELFDGAPVFLICDELP